MTSAQRSARHAARCAVAITAIVAAHAVLLFGAPGAGAHTDLVSSDPVAGARLDRPPAAVTLTFAGEPMELGATILVVDASDEQWNDGDAVVSATSVSVPLRAGAPDGWYQVRWRILSADGDLVSGSYDYGLGDLTGKEPVQLAVDQRTASGGDFDIEPQTSPGDGSATATTTGDGDGSPLRLVLVGALGALAGIGTYATTTTIRSRGRRRSNTKENQQ